MAGSRATVQMAGMLRNARMVRQVRTSMRWQPTTIPLRSYTVPPTETPPSASQPIPPSSNGEKKEGGSEQKYKRSRFKPIHIFLGITGAGLLVTFYGILEFYFALPQWPETVRTPLRRALRARNMKDYEHSEAFFKEALVAALALPPDAFHPDPLLKLSGIYITYCTMLEEAGQRREAYIVLRDGLDQFGTCPLSTDPAQRISGEWNGGRPLTHEDHIRAIGLAQKLGQLALQQSSAPRATVYPAVRGLQQDGPKSWLDAAEHHLSQALTAMLHLGLTPRSEGSAQKVIAGRDVALPESKIDPEGHGEGVEGGSVDKRGLGVTMEALAEIYARKGEHGIAGNLLIQAISTLLPPNSEVQPPITDQCQAAMLMTTVSSHALHPLTPKAIKASKSWSLRALQIADAAVQQAAEGGEAKSDVNTLICRKALAVGSYNLGVLAEMEGDFKTSLQHLNTALKVSRDIDFTEGKRQASEAIQRVRALSKASD